MLILSAQNSKNKPLVSVFVYCFNHEKYIRDCLDSILCQKTNFEFEVLVNDDCSSDNSAKIIKEYFEQYPNIIKPHIQKQNLFSRSISPTKYLAKHALGEFIAYCDGDDFWSDQNKLQTQIDVLVEDNSLVMCNHDAVEMIKNQLNFENKMDWMCRVDSTKKELRTIRTGVFLLGTLVHRNLIGEFPPEYDGIPNGDNFIPILLSKYGGSRYIASIKPLVYRRHPNSVFASKSSNEQIRMHVQSYLQISTYFVRTRDHESAIDFVTNKLKTWMELYLKTHGKV